MASTASGTDTHGEPDRFPELLRASEAARFLGMDVRTVRKAIADGQIPSVRLAQTTYVPLVRLRAWLAGE
jgi:excisionase family DNA binding protein